MKPTREEDVTFVDRAPWRVDVDREVEGTVDEVFAVLADTPSWVEWYPGLQRGVWTSAEPFGVGSTRQVKVTGGVKVDERFIAWEPGERWGFTFTAVAPPFAAAGVELVTLTAVGDGRTNIRYTMALEPSGVYGRIVALSKPAVRAVLQLGLRALGQELLARRG